MALAGCWWRAGPCPARCGRTNSAQAQEFADALTMRRRTDCVQHHPRQSGSAFAAIATMVLRGTLSTRARPGVVATARPAIVSDRATRSINGLVRTAIKQDDADPACLRDLAQYPVKRHCFVEQVALTFELSVGRYQIVFAIHLDAMAGIVDDRHIRTRRWICQTVRIPLFKSRKSGSYSSMTSNLRRRRLSPMARASLTGVVRCGAF